MTQPIRPEHADKVEPVTGADPRFTITRSLVGYAYPVNGNVGNPTPRYRWLLNLDGRLVDSADRRSVLVQEARHSGVAAYGKGAEPHVAEILIWLRCPVCRAPEEAKCRTRTGRPRRSAHNGRSAVVRNVGG